MDHFIRRLNLRKDRNIQGVSADVLAFLMNYPFPGNVRELENIIEYAFIACKNSNIDLEHLPKDVIAGRNTAHPRLSESDRMEADKIQAILLQYPRHHAEVARALGISRTTLWRRMKQYGIAESVSET